MSNTQTLRLETPDTFYGFNIKKTILTIVIIIIAIVIIYFTWSKVKKIFGKVGDATDKAILEAKGMTLTHPKAQYITFADTIHGAYGWAWDSNNVIYETIGKLKNDLDFLQLKEAYGVRASTYMGTMGTMEENMRWRLNANEIAKINSILRLNNISYQI